MGDRRVDRAAGSGAGLARFALSMWPAMAIAGGLAAAVALVRPSALWRRRRRCWRPGSSRRSSPTGSAGRGRPRAPLTEAERRALRRVARKTWHFFETFVGDEDHWLPPDNFQEVPDGRVAHRTSPTNQGLLLLSTLAAHDLGYIGLRALADRLEKTFDTFDRMEKHWGHFYNWYDTRTLRVLAPGVRLDGRQRQPARLPGGPEAGAEGEGRGALDRPRGRSGLADTLGLAADGAVGRRGRSSALLARDARRPPGWDDWLGRVDWAVTDLLGKLRARADVGPPDDHEAWARRLAGQVRARRAELAAVAPWLAPLRAWEEPAAPAWESDDDARRWGEVRSALVDPGLGLAARRRPRRRGPRRARGAGDVGPGRRTVPGDRRGRPGFDGGRPARPPPPPRRAGRGAGDRDGLPAALQGRPPPLSRSAATSRRGRSTAPVTTCSRPSRA